MRKRRGFSLVELLVVIGIIALLIAILLPVLNRTRSEAYKVRCMSNLRQLLTAEMMYVAENKGYLTYPNWSNDRQATDVWQTGWLYTQGEISNPLQQDDVKTGALYRYLNTTQVYHCPNHILDGSIENGTDRLTSYIMNGAVCGYGTVGNKDGPAPHWVPSWKITDWRKPSEQILLWEADENGNGSVAWNDGASYPRENLLAKRHGRGASVGYFDGRVEWMDRVDYITELQRPGPNRLYCDPERPDGGASAFGS